MVSITDIAKAYKMLECDRDREIIRRLLIACLSDQESYVFAMLATGATSSDVVDALKIKQQNACRALKNLCDYGLACRKQDKGKYIYYLA